MVNRRKPRKYLSSSTPELRFKLSRVISRHQQMTVAFNHLKSQIRTGLLEAEDVFTSLAIPLMRLVGLKTSEMAAEGKFSTIIMNADALSQPERPMTSNRSERRVKLLSLMDRGDQEDIYALKAKMAGKKLIQQQSLQLKQLVHILKKIEIQVNSSHKDILQNLADHRTSIHKFFQKAMVLMAAFHQAGQTHDAFLATLKLLKVTHEHVNMALGSLEVGVEDMMHELACKMCVPMVEYVKSLKTEMTTGTCLHLMALIEEMGGALKNGKLELEQARRKARVAEERNIEALSRLKKSEERIRTMREYLGFFLEAKGLIEYPLLHKFLGMEEDQAKDETLLWEALKTKQKYKKPGRPLGHQEIQSMKLHNNHLKSVGETSQTCGRRITRSYARGLAYKPCT